MKKRIISILALLPILAGSCLKDKRVENQDYGMEGTDTGRGLVEFPASPFFLYNLQASNSDTTFTYLTVRLNQNDPAPQDIQVTLVPDAALIGDYNTSSGGHYTLMDPADYRLESTTVTIPKGEREGSVKITINPANILDGAYALAFRISSVSPSNYTISRNYAGIVAAVGVKNKYDGVYQAKGYGNLGGNTTAPYLFSVPCSYELNVITAGPNSVYMDAQPLFRAGAIIAFSNVFPKFIFDLNTNKVTGMANDAPGNGIPFNYPIDGGTYDSRYDPATKTIYVRFGLNNSATWRVVDTLTYCGPR